MKTGISVGEAMTTQPIVIDPESSLVEAAKIMANNHVGSLLVKDNGNLLGIVTEQDIVRNAIAKDLETKSAVKNVMERKLVTITPEKDIFEALKLMSSLNIRQLPVKDSEEFMGLLTIKDILKIEPQLFDLVVDKFEIREESRKPISQTGNEGICELCGKLSPKIIEKDGSRVCVGCADI